MAYNAKAVANYFIDKSIEEDKPISPLKLQKMIYFAHGWHLALYNEPLINEKIEAWQYGPVIPSLYYEFSNYGAKDIDKHAVDYEIDIKKGKVINVVKKRLIISEADTRTKNFLDKIWDIYSGYSAIQLATFTHNINTPWKKIWNPSLPANTTIPDDDIKEYFINKIKVKES